MEKQQSITLNTPVSLCPDLLLVLIIDQIQPEANKCKMMDTAHIFEGV